MADNPERDAQIARLGLPDVPGLSAPEIIALVGVMRSPELRDPETLNSLLALRKLAETDTMSSYTIAAAAGDATERIRESIESQDGFKGARDFAQGSYELLWRGYYASPFSREKRRVRAITKDGFHMPLGNRRVHVTPSFYRKSPDATYPSGIRVTVTWNDITAQQGYKTITFDEYRKLIVDYGKDDPVIITEENESQYPKEVAEIRTIFLELLHQLS